MINPGNILDVDLSGGTVTVSPYPEAMTRQCLGGRGYNVEHLFSRLPAGTDPLGPENILMISCGLLTGTSAPASSRVHVNALSPQTGILGSSNVGGYFGSRLNAAGVQTLILRGRAPKPVCIFIDKEDIRFMDAASLWGCDTRETRERIKAGYPKASLSILSIGPAGEHQVPFACLMTDQDHAAGRTGMGAVLGAKNVKAVIVCRRPARNGLLSETQALVIKDYFEQIRKSIHFDYFHRHGGAGYVDWAHDMGILATRNYRSNRFDAARDLDGKQLAKYRVRAKGCHRCPVLCKADLFFHDGPFQGEEAVRPEFEPMVALGSKCGLSQPAAVTHLDALCARLGVDSISAGSLIAFAMDLFDRGILTRKDTGGIDLHWGSVPAMETLLHQMAQRKGFAAVLAKGIKKAASEIGRGADRFAPHVKGLELSAYHPFYIMGTALGYAVSSRGGDYNQLYAALEYGWSPEKARAELGTAEAVDLRSIRGKGALIRRAMLVNIALDNIGICKVPALSLIGAFDLKNEAALAAALTEHPIRPEHLFEAAERTANLERLFNLTHGMQPREDDLPSMFFEMSPSAGGAGSRRLDWLKPMVRDFYAAMGWEENGIPSENTLRRLGLEDALKGMKDWKKAG